MNTYIVSFNIIIEKKKMEEGRGVYSYRGERERLFSSREGEGKLKITFLFYGKGREIRKLLWEGKGREI